jgi:leucyl aminopeptidase (aminopeptidase T)
MNERIKQLWEEAAKTTQSDSWEEQTKFMERFAELIVRECINIVERDDGATELGELLLDHFIDWS